MKRDIRSLRTMLQRSVIAVGCTVFILAFVTALYLANRNFTEQEILQKRAIQETLTELLLSPLSISDYHETKRIIGSVNKQSDIYAVVTNEGDVLLSDYAQYPLISSAYDLRSDQLTCSRMVANNVKFAGTTYRVLCHEIIMVNILDGTRKNLGVLTIAYPVRLLNLSIGALVQLLIFAALTLVAAILIMRKVWGNQFLMPLENLVLAIKEQALDPLMENKALKSVDTVYEEISDLKGAYVELVNSFRSEHQRRIEADKQTAIVSIAQQVAHDIRSPLVALTMATSHAQELPEEKRLLIRGAVQRIQDIANDLAGKKIKNVASHECNDILSLQLLSSIIDAIISEKRLQYRGNIDIEITPVLDERSYGLFANINSSEFKRVISNIINNAVESITNKGNIIISLFSDNKDIIIQIIDNGKGIPEHIMPTLMRKGATYGKFSGTGLGLYHARTTFEKWKGSLFIDSKVDYGTTITLKLPKQSPPPWFVSELNPQPNSNVIIIDDDNSIHQIWKGRLEPWISSKLLKVLHFTDPHAFLKWHQNENTKLMNPIYLCDYEFLGQKQNGIDVIRQANIQDQAILVTSHYEEEVVRKDCEALGVRLIPKNLAGFVPITIQEDNTSHYDAILLDDDDLVHLNWQMAARIKKKSFCAYHTLSALKADLPRIPRQTSIYIDSCLGEGKKGEVIAEELHGLGFENLFLATGKDPSEFGTIPWIKGIQGKMPPWG